jgi:glutamine synthetase
LTTKDFFANRNLAMSNTEEALAWLPAWFSPEEIDTVVVAFPDVFGRLMGKRMTRSHFLQSVVKHGTHACNYLLTVDMEMNPLDGFRLASWDQGYGDFHLKPVLGTLHALPWSRGTALVLCDLEHEAGGPIVEAPRSILKAQIERLAAKDMSVFMASELEFYLFHDSYESAGQKRYQQLTPSSDYLIDYHVLQCGRDENVLRRIRNEMHEAGITVEGSKGEWGRGQHELNLLYAEAMQMADRHVIFKHGAKEIAAQEGRAITFMAKLASDQAGSSFHLHTSLWNAEGTRSRFVDKSDQPTSEFRAFLGGLLKYARELSYFFAPTINSYKRFQVASWAPTSLVWAHDNRTTALRVVGHGASLRIENRAPGADANPYLAYAATIAAGLQGIEEKLDCGEPYTGNAYINDSLPRLPKSLDEAADLLDGSQLARRALGDAAVDFYVHTARLECQAYRAAVTDWDLKRYFERI